MDPPICVSCQEPFEKNPRQKNQTYCSKPACQRARKNKWQRDKMKSDDEYRADQKQATKDWHQNNPDYWKTYRKKHQKKTLRNTLLQRGRNQKRMFCKMQANTASTPDSANLIAKMDALESFNHAGLTECWVVPVIAKMDVLKGYLTVNSYGFMPD